MSEQINREEWMAFLSGLDETTTVDELIESQEIAATYFDQLAQNIGADIQSSIDVSLPQGYIVGNYKILHQIGQGGMAQIYLAKRADDLFDQQVAIKLLSPYSLSSSHLDHFNRERELLASLNHPHIAKIFDGGVIEGNIPYLVMEYVDGVPIDQFVSANDLKTNDIVQLMVKVLGAIQHIHNRFILHRDIKPANILIDENHEPVIVDFGVSQNISFSQDEIMSSGTLKYLPPEVLQGAPPSTACDIYQTGLLLLELIDKHPISEQTHDKVVKQIAQWTFDHESKSIPKRLRSVLEISVARDPKERYSSAESFKNDLENYLSLKPIAADKTNVFGKVWLYTRRNTALVSLTFIVLIISVGSAIINQLQINETLREKAKLEQSNKFLRSIFKANDPNRTDGEKITAIDLLNASKDQIKNIENIEVKAYAQAQLGMLYAELGLWNESGPLFMDAVDNFQNSKQTNIPDLSNAYNNLAGYFRNVSEYQKADSTVDLAIRLLETNRNSYPIALGVSYKDKGYLQFLKGQYDEGEQTGRKAIELLTTCVDEGITPNQEYTQIAIIELSNAYNYLSSNLRELSKYNEALEAAKTAMTLAEPYKKLDHSAYYTASNNLALAFNRLGEYEKQIDILKAKINEELNYYAPDNPRILSAMANLGSAYYQFGNYEKSDSLTLIAYNTYLEKFGPTNQHTVSTLYNLGNSKYEQGKHDEALGYFEKVLTADIETLGKNHPYVASDYISLGNVQMTKKNYAEAKTYYQQALDIYLNNFGDMHQKTSFAHSKLGYLYAELGDKGRAISHFQKAVNIVKEVLGTEHRYYVQYSAELDSLTKTFKEPS